MWPSAGRPPNPPRRPDDQAASRPSTPPSGDAANWSGGRLVICRDFGPDRAAGQGEAYLPPLVGLQAP
eukprot:12015833-Alexandrium_andersonii.AAC.1